MGIVDGGTPVAVVVGLAPVGVVDGGLLLMTVVVVGVGLVAAAK